MTWSGTKAAGAIVEDQAPIESAEWSPDGRHILIRSRPPSSESVLRVRTAEGTDGRTVPESTGAEASWSPDGMRLLVWFSDRRAPGLQERISRISWSSDGRRILVTPLYGDSLLWSADGTAEPLTIRLGRRFAAEVVTA